LVKGLFAYLAGMTWADFSKDPDVDVERKAGERTATVTITGAPLRKSIYEPPTTYTDG
jgi:hypothetical protein